MQDKTSKETKTTPEATYEELMAQLGQILKTMENAGTSLEEQLVNYETGMKLCQALEERLKAAEEKILIINQQGQEESFE